MRAFPRVLFPLAALLLGAFIASGCDPKLTGNDDDGNPDPDPTPPAVADEALALAALLGLHMDMIKSSLAISAQFDTTIAPSARSVFMTDCTEVTVVDAGPPYYGLSIAGCVDHRGTEIGGFVSLGDYNGVDGFQFYPDGDAATFIRGINGDDLRFNHTFDSGDLYFTFERDGSDLVDGVVITRFLRHNVAGDILTISYVSVAWAGGHDSHAAWPAADAVIRISWDGVGVFDVDFSGTSSASFTLGGLPYTVDLDDGSVALSL
jgi:hypothetical protein